MHVVYVEICISQTLHIPQLQNCSRCRVKRDDKQIYKVVADGYIVKCVKCTLSTVLLIPRKKRIRICMIKKKL